MIMWTIQSCLGLILLEGKLLVVCGLLPTARSGSRDTNCIARSVLQSMTSTPLLMQCYELCLCVAKMSFLFASRILLLTVSELICSLQRHHMKGPGGRGEVEVAVSGVAAVPIGKLKLSVAILGYEHYLSMFILPLGAGADFLTCTKRVLIHLIIAISGKSSKYTTLSFVKIYKGPSDRLQVEIKCGINNFRMISFNGTCNLSCG
ncbi:hypothetical protein POTOM_008034 [Populus tomentosa]|uniref:Uncharacterized protein n=1 Tax=Populus tomentosa TaxID=118781 RepID=A0A8X8AB88_POPTO|nr:hypothetical protein POTOM_008034 [Populus tomentosa]